MTLVQTEDSFHMYIVLTVGETNTVKNILFIHSFVLLFIIFI